MCYRGKVPGGTTDQHCIRQSHGTGSSSEVGDRFTPQALQLIVENRDRVSTPYRTLIGYRCQSKRGFWPSQQKNSQLTKSKETVSNRKKPAETYVPPGELWQCQTCEMREHTPPGARTSSATGHVPHRCQQPRKKNQTPERWELIRRASDVFSRRSTRRLYSTPTR